MVWKKRAGRKYYYRSVKVTGHVKSVYFGAGGARELASAEDERISQQRYAGRQQREEVRGTVDPGRLIFAECSAWIDTLMRASLVLAGFYTHKRTWRPRHGHRSKSKAAG